MLDLKLVRENPELIRDALKKRNIDLDLDEIIRTDSERRACITELQDLKQRRNALSEEVGQLKRQGGGDAMYPPDAREWDEKKRDDWDHKLEKSRIRIKDAVNKRGGLSDADRESAIFSVEGAARHGVPIKTAEETVEHAIKRGMRGEDIEKMTRAMAYGADKNIDQNNIGKFLGNFHKPDMDTGHGRTALLINEFCRYGLRQIRQKYGVTSAIGPLLVNSRSAPQEKIVDFLRVDAGFFYQFRQQLR